MNRWEVGIVIFFVVIFAIATHFTESINGNAASYGTTAPDTNIDWEVSK